MVRLLVKAGGWWAQLRDGEIDITKLAAQEKVSAAYVTRIVRLAFLSPALIEAILAGKVRAGVDAAALTATGAVSPLWEAQARVLLPAR